jgi:histidine triad (HIT) family protein
MSDAGPCIFCEIVAGRAPAARIYETETTLAFLDLFPAATGHSLVIPKHHHRDLFDADPETLPAVVETARCVARALRTALRPDGLGVFQLNGRAAGQTVFHYHIHLIPRSQGDSLRVHGREAADRECLERDARRIAEALEAR